MKLDEKNARFAVIATAFHGGGVISFHKSLKAALRADKESTQGGCTCGCCAVVPITREARRELARAEYSEYSACDESEITLYKDLPCYTGNEHYSRICK